MVSLPSHSSTLIEVSSEESTLSGASSWDLTSQIACELEGSTQTLPSRKSAPPTSNPNYFNGRRESVSDFTFDNPVLRDVPEAVTIARRAASVEPDMRLSQNLEHVMTEHGNKVVRKSSASQASFLTGDRVNARDSGDYEEL